MRQKLVYFIHRHFNAQSCSTNPSIQIAGKKHRITDFSHPCHLFQSSIQSPSCSPDSVSWDRSGASSQWDMPKKKKKKSLKAFRRHPFFFYFFFFFPFLFLPNTLCIIWIFVKTFVKKFVDALIQSY